MTGRKPGLWWTPKAILLHCVLAVVTPGFSALFWWQVQRVREGNTLSWAYVFEWPFFLGYAVYLWWKVVHDSDEQSPAAATAAAGRDPARPTTPPGTPARASRPAPPASVPTVGDGPHRASPEPEPPPTASEDEELAAYNRYLAELNAAGRPKRW